MATPATSYLQTSAGHRSAEVLRKIRLSFETSTGQQRRDELHRAFDHHFNQPGKLSRSTCALACSEALGIDTETALAFAACVESLHNASLVLDDFQDGTLLRRQRPSVHALFGGDVAIGLTLQLSTTSFVCLSSATAARQLPDLITEVHRSVADTVLGQVRDLSIGTAKTPDDARDIARLKSGPLFGLALSLPLIAGGYPEFRSVAHEIAQSLGLGYQILDDIKDRVTDRASEADANIVNSLETANRFKDAKTTALAMASEQLQRAAALAQTLPRNSGDCIVRMVTQLQRTAS